MERARAPACPRPYTPRRPEHSPLYRVLADHFDRLEREYEERFERTHGPLRPAARCAAARFLDCGLLEHGFARVRCEACRAEFLVAFRCKGRQFCPSCHARRLAEWSLWLEESLLLDVPHRQVVLTLPKRLRTYFSYDRRRLGGLSRLAARVLGDYLQAAIGDRDADPGMIVCVQTFGSIVHWHPHLHVLITDGVFTRDGRFLPARAHDPALLQEAFRRAVLAWFAREGWLEDEAAEAMLAWPHSGFGAHIGPVIAGDNRQSLTRVARYGARAPIAEDRLRYHAERAEVEVVSDAASGPYVGVHRLDALEFLARWVHHVPDHYETRVRYYGAYATRRRLWWRWRGIVPEGTRGAAAPGAPPSAAAAPSDDWPALRARKRRWAELLSRVFEIEVSVCPACAGAMRIVAFVTAQQAVRKILAHLERRAIDARAGPWADAAA